jgi:hypothetical protein
MFCEVLPYSRGQWSQITMDLIVTEVMTMNKTVFCQPYFVFVWFNVRQQLVNRN